MKSRIVFAIAMGLILFNIGLVYSMQLGVKTGGWIKLVFTYTTDNPSGTPTPTWMKIEFLNVTETKATIRMTIHMSDGKEQNQTTTYDLPSAISTNGPGPLSGLVIPLGSKVGDTIRIPPPYENVTINSETTRSYAGANRIVLYANSSAYGTQRAYYWDKQTGVAVEVSEKSAGTSTSGKLTETNMWQEQFLGLPINSTTFYVLVAAIAVIVVASIILAGRRRKKPQPSEEASIPPPAVQGS